MKYPIAATINIKQKFHPITLEYMDTYAQADMQYEDSSQDMTLRFSHLGLFGESYRPRISALIGLSKDPSELSHLIPDMVAAVALRMSAYIVNRARDDESKNNS